MSAATGPDDGNGRAFQARDAGSIPVTRSTNLPGRSLAAIGSTPTATPDKATSSTPATVLLACQAVGEGEEPTSSHVDQANAGRRWR
jgi:hypothetical protein